MASFSSCHPNVCMCLLLQAFLFQAIALKLESNQNEVGGDRGGNLAVCISGGLRQGDECAESHVRSLVEASRANFNHVKIFYATWEDRQCLDGGWGPVNESFIRGLYPNEDMDVWIGTPPFLTRDPALAGAAWPHWWTETMFRGSHNMAFLWQKCMDMIPDTYDVIVRTRPDWCFPSSYKLNASPKAVLVGRAGSTNELFEAHLEEGKVFVPKSMYHSQENILEIPDDRMGFGLAKPMKQAYGTMAQRMDQHDFDLSDEQYYKKWGKPDAKKEGLVLNPHGFFAREPAPEIMLAHHLLNMNINYTFIEPVALSLWEVGTRGILCGSGFQHGRNESIPPRNSNLHYYDYN